MSKRVLTALCTFVTALTVCVSTAGAQDQVETAYAAIKPSLILVANYQGGKLFGIGTGFVVGHHNGHMLVITNRHVVEGGDSFTGIIQFPTQASFGLTPVKVGTSDDLALLESTKFNAPAVSLATTLPALGHAISIAGYPHTQLVIASKGGGLSPSVHAGNVNALPENGYYIQYDAQSDHGNSGGPLFDVDTGVVYGVVVIKLGSIETNFAISAVRLRTFLANAGVFPSSDPMVTANRGPDRGAPFGPALPAGAAVSVDHAACTGAMREFVAVLKENMVSFDHYTDAQHVSTEAFRVSRDRQALVEVDNSFAQELSAIQNIIRDEPKLLGFHERIAAAGATATARGIETLVTDIATRDQDALQGSLERKYILDSALNGVTFDKPRAGRGDAITRMQLQVVHDIEELKNAGNCKR